MIPNWNRTSIALATTFHVLAVLTTVFRLWYRHNTARLWWEDAWALVALLADIMCLVTTWLERPVAASVPHFYSTGNRILSFAFTAVIWASRISILVSIVRVSRPEGTLKSVAIGIGVAFGVMWLGLVGQRIQVCVENNCILTRALIVAQTITDCIADVLLTGLPIVFLRDVRLDRKRKLLIFATFSASMVINVVTVVQAVVLLSQVRTSGTIIISHVKYALALIVCNLLVIVTWVYRVVNGDGADLDDSNPSTSKIEFTTVEVHLGISQEISMAATKSSSWSFRGPGRSGVSSSVTGTS